MASLLSAPSHPQPHSLSRSPSPHLQPHYLHEPLHPYVQQLSHLLSTHSLQPALDAAIHSAIHTSRLHTLLTWHIEDTRTFLSFASHLLTSWIPSETRDGRFIYSVLTTFYYLFSLSPLSTLQTPIHPSSITTTTHSPLMTPLSTWIRGFALRMGSWLSTSPSLTPTSYASFLTSPKYRMTDYHHPCPTHPTGGFTSFNELFCRKLRSPYPYSDVRPIASLTDPDVVCFPADSTFDGSWRISDDNSVLITSSPTSTSTSPQAPPLAQKKTQEGEEKHIDSKGLKWPIATLLSGSPYAARFAGGTWAHAFLNTYDYHRLHAPVAGKVVEARNVRGLCMLEVGLEEVQDSGKQEEKEREAGANVGALEGGGGGTVQPQRRFSQPTHTTTTQVATKPMGSGKAQEATAPNNAGYQFLQTRGLMVIDTGRRDVGMVAVLPMGMASVSSVKLSVAVGDEVRKGEEIAWFEFGGSDIVMVFEKGARVGRWAEEGEHKFMGMEMCRFGVEDGEGEFEVKDVRPERKTSMAVPIGEALMEVEGESESDGEAGEQCYEYFSKEYSMVAEPVLVLVDGSKLSETIVAVEEVHI